LGDRLHQPYRASLYPRSAELVAGASGLGALGASISGAGPTVLVWVERAAAGDVARALHERAAGWADVLRVEFVKRGAEVA
ncbi:MAG TPA: homoserine kinase, partial [Solirubrobacteraceae bacterium]|nr:homoserine kinase [Solirubrobacteraceae bacterium]